MKWLIVPCVWIIWMKNVCWKLRHFRNDNCWKIMLLLSYLETKWFLSLILRIIFIYVHIYITYSHLSVTKTWNIRLYGDKWLQFFLIFFKKKKKFKTNLWSVRRQIATKIVCDWLIVTIITEEFPAVVCSNALKNH